MTTPASTPDTPTDIRKESLIEYPSLFPIKVMGAKVDGFVHAVTLVAEKFDPQFDASTIELRTSKEGDGAQLGDYEVAILEHRVAIAGEGSPLAPQRLPERYYDFKTSGLKATVKPGLNPVTLVVERLGAEN